MSHGLRRILIRADATPQMGTGHVMRCMALLLAAQQMGIETLLTGYFDVPWLRQRLNQEKIPHHSLSPGKPSSSESPQEFLEYIQNFSPDSVILDGYHFELSWQTAVIKAGYTLLLIDDYGHLPEYHCNLLLNQNTGVEAISYNGIIDKKLFGPQYALLRPEFSQARKTMRPRGFEGSAQRILISLGGGDFSYYLARLIALISPVVDRRSSIQVIGGSMPDEIIYNVFAKTSLTVEVLRNIKDMPSVFLNTDLCISAAGSTCWELCCLGVPFITVVVAENQNIVANWLAKSAIAPQLTIDSFRYFLDNPQARSKASEAGIRLIDGTGAHRVLSKLDAMHQRCDIARL